ncbi:MAG: Fur family transcriptional regulator [Dehalococcoidales bacterium]|nr:Fur family transcriptional regulator [Dehalococcoidales bacterium]
MKTTRQEIIRRGLKVTNQRTIILEAIRTSRGHVDADEVWQRIHKKYPRLSLSTVYRTLQKFKQSGLVEELHFSEEHHHYELKPTTEHYHLVCNECGSVTEFKYPLTKIVQNTVPEAAGFKITGADVTLTGICPKCRPHQLK